MLTSLDVGFTMAQLPLLTAKCCKIEAKLEQMVKGFERVAEQVLF